MNEQVLGVVLVDFGLLMFGILYTLAVGWAKPKGYMEPYTALWVAAGTLVTIIGVAIMDQLVAWNAGLIALMCFAASGTPMIIGDAARYVAKVQHEMASLRRMGNVDEQGKALAK